MDGWIVSKIILQDLEIGYNLDLFAKIVVTYVTGFFNLS